MIQQHLQKLGFSENEIKIYLALVELGRATPSLLAKKINLPRTTAYSILESLKRKGVVDQNRKGKTTFFLANSPESILRLITTEKKSLANKEIIAKELVELISPHFKSKKFSVPKLKFYDGSQEVENMLYENFDSWQESIHQHDSTWWGYQDHSFVENYLEWLEFAWKRKKDNEKIKLFSNHSKIEEKLKGKISNREIRPFSSDMNFLSTIWVCGDYIVMIMTKDKPHYSFQILDPVFAANLRVIFQLLWKIYKF